MLTVLKAVPTGNSRGAAKLGSPGDRFAAYDALPPRVRKFLQHEPLDTCPLQVRRQVLELIELVDRLGEDQETAVAFWIEARQNAVVGEVEEFARIYEWTYRLPYPHLAAAATIQDDLLRI